MNIGNSRKIDINISMLWGFNMKPASLDVLTPDLDSVRLNILSESKREGNLFIQQHYDSEMSDVLSEELDIPKPDYNLGICPEAQGSKADKMLMINKKVLLEENPDLITRL